jgi:hypothetical protein
VDQSCEKIFSLFSLIRMTNHNTAAAAVCCCAVFFLFFNRRIIFFSGIFPRENQLDTKQKSE